ncbi:MAG: FG-GAP repeat domain-containing protein, partial [Candidatus Hodarchaeota archaeon]
FSGDGLDDIVVRSFANGSYCFRLDAGAFNLTWAFEDRSIFYIEEYQVADLNNDTILDVITLNYDNIIALSGVPSTPTQVIWASFVPTNLILSTIVGDFNGDEISDVALGTADHWVYILYGKEDHLIEQQGGHGGQIQGRIIANQDLPSLIKDSQIIILLPNLYQLKIHRKALTAFLLAIGIFTTLTYVHTKKKRRFKQ